jgi:hypothetical protein
MADIGFQQDPRLQQPLRRALSLPDQRFELFVLLGTQSHHISFYRNLLAAMIPSAVNNDDKSESPNPFEMVEAGD